jgi:hypothetical protein
MAALDEAAGDVVRHRGDDAIDVRAFRDQNAAVPRVLEKPIGPAVVPEIDEADHVEEQSRPLAVNDAGVEQLDAFRRLIQDRPHCLREQFQPRDLCLTQVVHDFALFGAFDARAPDGLLQAGGNRLQMLRLALFHVQTRIHIVLTYRIGAQRERL